MRTRNFLTFILAPLLLFVLCSGTLGGGRGYEPAFYPGGIDAVDSYMNDSARYPEAEWQARKEGFVLVTFTVSETGKAVNPVVTALGDSSAGFNAEARRLVAAMPAWEPAKNKKGKPTPSTHRTYVKFELPDSLISIPPLLGDTVGEQMPRFPGDEAAFQYYLQRMIRYPQVEKETGRDGVVYIYFEVENTGRILNTKCAKGVPGASGLAKEAVRVVSVMPRWIPGRVKGKPVKVGMTVPVRFILH